MTDPSEPTGRDPEAPKPFEPMPSAPAIDEAPPPAPVLARPKPVNVAFILWLALGVFLLLGTVVLLATSDATLQDSAREILKQQGKSTPTDQEVSDTASFIRIAGVSTNLVVLALATLLAFLMRAGKNWARITLTALGVVLIALTFLGGGTNLIFVLIQLLLILGAVVLMFGKESNAYFAANRPRRF